MYGIGVNSLIETIYSNESEEAGGTGSAQTSFRMPKNIRQVGKSNTTRKIYVEDYVMTFIKQLSGGDYSGCNIAVLVGQCVKIDNCRNIFISGAVEVKDANATGEILFTNDTWTAIYEDIKKYFVDTEIVGWFIGGPGYLFSEEEKIQKIHVDNFAGQDKILLTYDNLEKEENFLNYENNHLTRLEGYYIYYEKNDEMQSYIIDHKKVESIEANYDDKVSREIRTVLQNKKPAEEETKSVTRLMYAAGTLMAVIVLIVGAAMLRNYDQMKNMQATLNYLSKSMTDVQNGFTNKDSTSDKTKSSTSGTKKENKAKDKTAASKVSPTVTAKSDEEGLDVEVAPGNVKPLEDAKSGDNADKQNSNGSGTSSDKDLADSTKKTTKSGSSDTKKETTKSSGSSKTAKADVKYYTVQNGDTLADISYKLYKTYTKVDKIMELNGITDQDLVYAGQKLIVP